MGLDFSHGDGVSFSYGGFNLFRKKLAQAVGVDLYAMQGFGGNKQWSTVKHDLKPLLDHSDCDGQISAKRCCKIAPHIRKIVKEWPNTDSDKSRGIRLAEAMEECAKKKEPLLFQ